VVECKQYDKISNAINVLVLNRISNTKKELVLNRISNRPTINVLVIVYLIQLVYPVLVIVYLIQLVY